MGLEKWGDNTVGVMIRNGVIIKKTPVCSVVEQAGGINCPAKVPRVKLRN